MAAAAGETDAVVHVKQDLKNADQILADLYCTYIPQHWNDF